MFLLFAISYHIFFGSPVVSNRGWDAQAPERAKSQSSSYEIENGLSVVLRYDNA